MSNVPLNGTVKCGTIDVRTRIALMTVREALLLVLGEIEDYLGEPRTKPARRR